MAKSNSARTGILLGLLALMLGALLWDQFVARPGSQAAYDAVNEMVQDQLAASKEEGMKGPEDVHALLGREPSSESVDDGILVERYNWMRGTVVSSYFVNVVYKKRKGEWYLEKSLLNQENEILDLEGPTYEGPEISEEDLSGTPQDPTNSETDPPSNPGPESPETPETPETPVEEPAVEEPTEKDPPADPASAESTDGTGNDEA